MAIAENFEWYTESSCRSALSYEEREKDLVGKIILKVSSEIATYRDACPEELLDTRLCNISNVNVL